MDTESLCLRPSPFPAASTRAFSPWRELLAELFSGGAYTALHILEALNAQPGGRVLDVGTGRGVLPLLLQGTRPDLTVVGIDADGHRARRARRDAARAGASVHFGAARAEYLPFASGQFDAVVSTLMLHHLPFASKAAACREFARVLKRDGFCYVADFAPPRTACARWAATVPRLTCFPHVAESFRGCLPDLLHGAGFAAVEEVYQTAASVSLFRARSRAAQEHGS